MTYRPQNTISFADTSSVDAFSRARVSQTDQRLDVEFIYDKQDEYFDEILNNGTVTHNANARDLRFAITDANDGTYAKMASYPVPYTPGNSQLVEITGVLDLAGIGGGNAEVFLRSKVTGTVAEEVIPQSSWLDAKTGVDWTKSHILAMDFQSLKVGRIRFALNVGGSPVSIAQITNDNEINTGYWQIPHGSVYWHLYNDATYTYMECGYGDDDNAIGLRYKIAANASATMSAICCTVKSEGGGDVNSLLGLPRSIDMGVTEKTASTTLIPLLSIRPRDTFVSLPNKQLVLPKKVIATTTQPVRIVLIHNGTLTGASWANVSTDNSCVEYDVTATAITGGHELDTDYITAGKDGASSQNVLGKTFLWDRQNTHTGILTVAAQKTGATDASVLAGLHWEEIR